MGVLSQTPIPSIHTFLMHLSLSIKQPKTYIVSSFERSSWEANIPNHHSPVDLREHRHHPKDTPRVVLPCATITITRMTNRRRHLLLRRRRRHHHHLLELPHHSFRAMMIGRTCGPYGAMKYWIGAGRVRREKWYRNGCWNNCDYQSRSPREYIWAMPRVFRPITSCGYRNWVSPVY